MIRETKLYECEDTDDLLDAFNLMKERKDGGRTHIELTGKFYPIERPLKFDVDDRVTLNFNGLGIFENGEGAVIREVV